MTFFLVFLTTLALAFWVILRLFRGKSAALGGATIGGAISSGFSNFLKPIMERGWVRPVAILASLALLYFFWDSISSGLTSLLVDSDAGETVGLKKEPVQRWLWIPGIILGIWLLMRLFKSPGTASGKGSFSVDKPIREVGDAIFLIIVGLVVGGAVLGFTALVLDIAGVPKTVAELPMKFSHTAACTTQDEAWHIRIDSAKRHMVVCPEEKALYVLPEQGYERLVFDFSAEFKEKHRDLLEGRKLEDFVLISAPHEYRGHAAGVWRIMPLQSRPELKFVSAWDRSGMKDIAIVAYAAN